MHYFTQNPPKFSGDGAQPSPQILPIRHLWRLNPAPFLRGGGAENAGVENAGVDIVGVEKTGVNYMECGPTY